MEKMISNIQMELDMDYNDTMFKMKNEQDIKQLKKYEKKLNLISNLKKYYIAYLNLRKMDNVVIVDEPEKSKSKSKKSKKSDVDDNDNINITLKNI